MHHPGAATGRALWQTGGANLSPAHAAHEHAALPPIGKMLHYTPRKTPASNPAHRRARALWTSDSPSDEQVPDRLPEPAGRVRLRPGQHPDPASRHHHRHGRRRTAGQPRYPDQRQFAPEPERPANPGQRREPERRAGTCTWRSQRTGRRVAQYRHQPHRHPGRWRHLAAGPRLHRAELGYAAVRRQPHVHRHGHRDLPGGHLVGGTHRRSARPGLGAVWRRRHRCGGQRGAEKALRGRDRQPPAPGLRQPRQPADRPRQRRLAHRQPELPPEHQPAAQQRLDRPRRLQQHRHQCGAALAGQ